MKAATCLVCIVAMSLFSECGESQARAAVNAVAQGDIERARTIYASGVDPDTRFDDLTALMMSACHAPPEAIEMLLEAGADPGLASRSGWTPLSYAAQCGNLPVVRLLVEAGADPNGASPAGATPLSVARSAGAQEVVELLLDAGADGSVVRGVARR